MRCLAPFALVFAAGCVEPQTPPDPPPDPGGWTGPQGPPASYGCETDSECGALTCARDGACYPASSVRWGHVHWTIGGVAPTIESCSAHANLFVRFSGSSVGDWFGFSPVPCAGGLFSVDKLPTMYTRVELGPDGTDSGTPGTIDPVTGDATIDLR